MGYPVAGAAAGCGPYWGSSIGVILVLFILLVIISRAFFI
ncbi:MULTISPECIES: YjcZ family sporulation protein [Paenibacillus]|nr:MULTISPECIES: YjcZ family sporulation protein [Paenibacillus]